MPTKTSSQTLLQQGLELARNGQITEAQVCFEKILATLPNDGGAWHNLGLCQLQLNHTEKAKASFEAAIQYLPKAPHSHLQLGLLAQNQQAFETALVHYHLAWEQMPGLWAACENGCNLLLECGDSDAAIEWLEEAVQLPECPEHPWRLLCFYLLASDHEPARLEAACKGWEARFMRPLYPAEPRWKNLPDPNRKLKIGYLSADFSLHSATNTYSALFEFADRQNFELHAFYTRDIETSSTEWFRQGVDSWHAVHDLGPEALAEKIRAHEIDILVDLSGITGDDLRVLALRPAPLQLTGLGFGATTGLSCMQGRFTDRFLNPPEAPGWNSEPLIYLKQVFHWFPNALHQKAQLQPPPCLSQKTLTLGCGNNPFKYSQATLSTWARILQEMPNAHLKLKFTGLEQAPVQEALRKRLHSCGIPVEKVSLLGHSSLWEHLQFYQTLDLALDPFPYNGGVTTCEALWMGVPVISLEGGTRAGASILKTLGLKHWLAQTPDEYVMKVRALLLDASALSHWRSLLRNRLLKSSICDGPGFTRDLEKSYRQLWQTWCLNQVSD